MSSSCAQRSPLYFESLGKLTNYPDPRTERRNIVVLACATDCNTINHYPNGLIFVIHGWMLGWWLDPNSAKAGWWISVILLRKKMQIAAVRAILNLRVRFTYMMSDNSCIFLPVFSFQSPGIFSADFPFAKCLLMKRRSHRRLILVSTKNLFLNHH